MKKQIFFIYGLLSYLLFLVVFVYAIGFVANIFVPKSIDSGTQGEFLPSLLINIGLIGLFAVQHSIMARRNFKKWWTTIIPKPVERSTFVFVTSIVLILLMWLWQPMPETIWHVSSQSLSIVLWSIYAFGWIFIFISTRLINDRHLFGLQQVKQHMKGEKITDPEFQTPSFYKFTRHPMMLGFIIAFWATPHMTLGHLIFAATFTIYILFGIQLEERDLSFHFKQRYDSYKEQVPMLIPGLRLKGSKKYELND